MATTTSVTTTYAGEHSGKWISAALLSGVTLSNELITIMPNVKYKSVVSNLVSASGLADASCDFTATGAVTLTERILEPKSLQVNKQLCKADFRDTFQAIEMGYSAHDVLPKSFADYLLAHQAEQVAADIESHIWNGDANNSGEFNGFMTLLTTDAALPAAQEVSGTTLSASNIITEMGKLADSIPSRLYGKEGLRIYVSQNAMRLYVRALGGFGTSGLGANGVDNKGTMWYQGGELMFDGIPVVVANGLTADQMLASTKENLFFGTGLLSDQNQVKLIDLADIDGSENVRLIMRMTAGVQYGNVTDICTYGITNAVN
jgi:hypothetical protein